MHQIERIPLPITAIGNERHITVHRFGESGGLKAYIHTTLHADEWPGLLVTQHLLAALRQADADGQIKGEIIIVPAANPIGLNQMLNYYLAGRYDFAATGNFNRNFPALNDNLLAKVQTQLGQDAEHNVQLIRSTLRELIQAAAAGSEAEAMKYSLLGLAIDADIVLDLHCDSDALMHIYAPQAQSEIAEQLSADLGARALLLEHEPGGGAFDQACSSPWRIVQEACPQAAVPLACFSATVELRGANDVNHELAKADSANLFRFLQRRGLISGEAGALPEPCCQATPLQGTDVIRSPGTGILSYHKQLGDWVNAGDTVADLVVLDDLSQILKIIPITSQASGVLFTRVNEKLVRPGGAVAKVAGDKALDYRQAGALLGE